MIKGKLVVQIKIEDLDFYYNLEPGTRVYIKNLKCQGIELLAQALDRNITVYQLNGNPPTDKKDKWFKHATVGLYAPKTMYIQLSNGVHIYDYDQFEKKAETEEEMMPVAEELLQFSPKSWSISQLMKEMMTTTGLARIASVPDEFKNNISHKCPTWISEGGKNYSILGDAMKGGANYIFKYNKIRYETHIDFHQLYASILVSHDFPYMKPEIHDGFVESEFAIYEIQEENGGFAQLKPDGYPIIACGTTEQALDGTDSKMFAADGRIHPLTELGSICSVDYQLLLDNYDIIEPMQVARTLVYKYHFSGEKIFSDFVDFLYQKRMTTTGTVKNLYKRLNEFIAGYFEKSAKSNNWWKTLERPPLKNKTVKNNPIIGIFITAYAREQLNKLLHMFRKADVIGYDTDCVFFKGSKERVPAAVMAHFGDNPGELHYDGIYKDVIHTASKHYSGFDMESGKPFKKASGETPDGKKNVWNPKIKRYELKEVKKHG